MASSNYQEEKCFNIHWEIKNFNYSWKMFKSPKFTYIGCECYVILEPTSTAVHCKFNRNFTKEWQISFLTNDGSPTVTASGVMTETLQVPKDVIFGKRRKAFLPKGTLTVQCRIPDDKYKEETVFLRSEIEVKRRCFYWSLENLAKGKYSKNITIENSDRYGEIKLKPVDSNDIDKQINLEVLCSGGEGCFCVLRVSMQGMDGKDIDCGNGEIVFQKQEGQQTWTFTSFIKNNKLLPYKDQLPANDQIYLKCDFALTSGALTSKDSVICFYAGIKPLLTQSD